MHERLLARAAWPAPVSVMGLLLKPYSLGHELLLTRTENRLALGPHLAPSDPPAPSEATYHDLSSAVWICCQSWKENQRASFDPLIRLKLWIWRKRCRKLNFERELLGFLQYRAAGSLEFPLSDTTKPGTGRPPRIPGAPFLIRLHQFKVTRYNLDQAEAWDYPLGLAKCEWATYWEQEQGLEIYNLTDQEYDRKAQAILKQIEEEEKCRAS